MTVLVTGAAGFIGFHVASALLARGEPVVGIDNLNSYYDVALKQARLARLEQIPGFAFQALDLGERDAATAAFDRIGPLDGIVHLAAQAGVRHSLNEPHAYIDANITGHLVVLEACRRRPELRHLVYASSSSVYGGNRKLPFSVGDPVERPLSLYGATKRADELMSAAYAHLFRTPMTGLRFFTVYGPWGRPDMSAYLFTKAIFAGEPIRVFNRGEMRRDFTYIDDIVAGVLAALDRPPSDDGEEALPHRLYNLGNNRSEPLMRFIEVIERACNRKAVLDLQPMQPGDVRETFADITAAQAELGFAPRTPIDAGIPHFVQWFREYHGV